MLTEIEVGKLYGTTLGVIVVVEKIEPLQNDYLTKFVFYKRLDLPNELRSIEYSKALTRWRAVEDVIGWRNEYI